MLNTRERKDIQFKRLSGLSLLRLVGKVMLGVLTLQVLTAGVLLVIAALGKRRKHEVSFPHEPFEEVQVGENSLQLYAYGRDLFDAMLEAIDAAQESIYLETYIWKDDAVGQEFQEHLARKAEEVVDGLGPGRGADCGGVRVPVRRDDQDRLRARQLVRELGPSLRVAAVLDGERRRPM